MAYCLRSHSVWRASTPYGQSFGFNFYAPCLRLVHGWAAGWKWYKTNLSLAGNKDETGKLPRFSNGFQKWTADQKKRAKTRETCEQEPQWLLLKKSRGLRATSPKQARSYVCPSQRWLKAIKLQAKPILLMWPLQEFNRLLLRCDYATREPKQNKLRLLI